MCDPAKLTVSSSSQFPAPLLHRVQHDHNRRAVRPKECHRVQVALSAGNQPHFSASPSGMNLLKWEQTCQGPQP